MSPRFYLPMRYQEGVVLEMAGTEAHHLLHVLRLKTGETIEVFDGAGTEADARIDSVSRSSARVTILNVRDAWDRHEIPLILCSAVPKGDRFDWLVEKATEIGVTQLVPLLTTRSVVDPRSSKLDRLRQVIIAAAKQCGRGRLMQLDEPLKFDDLWKGALTDHVICLADPAGLSMDRVLDPMQPPPHSSRGVVVIIGPEGGFTDEELRTADEHHAQRFTLGRSILRIETAAILAAGIFRERLSRDMKRA
ncbi:MAG: RsmE family RNA methyltransferase [Planctomycetaceae bacterium]